MTDCCTIPLWIWYVFFPPLFAYLYNAEWSTSCFSPMSLSFWQLPAVLPSCYTMHKKIPCDQASLLDFSHCCDLHGEYCYVERYFTSHSKKKVVGLLRSRDMWCSSLHIFIFVFILLLLMFMVSLRRALNDWSKVTGSRRNRIFLCRKYILAS